MENANILETESISKLMWKFSPPLMLALFIQSIYNIVDSLFVAWYSADALTSLSFIYPLQLLMIAVATGTGSGINTNVARLLGQGRKKRAEANAYHGILLGVFNWLIISIVGILILKKYFQISSNNQAVIDYGMEYGVIIIIFSFGMFLEGNLSKILQATGDMTTPTIAQIIGALINIVLDYVLIFGKFGFPEMGLSGAAIATVLGQTVAMIIVLICVLKSKKLKIKPTKLSIKTFLRIYKDGLPNIVMQALFTIYIFGLNVILKSFTEDAVTVLSIYYKLQTFFWLPLMALQQAILPIVSYNYGAGKADRMFKALKYALFISIGVLFLSTIVFIAVPQPLLAIYTNKAEIFEIGSYAFPIIALSFMPAAFNLTLPIFFQAVCDGKKSIFLTVLRQLILFVPVAWILSFFGLNAVWLTFPISDGITLITGLIMFFIYKKKIFK